MSSEELEDLPSEELPDGPPPSALPIGEILAAIYRHIWRYRRPYLAQLAVWTVLMWLSQFPARIIVVLLSWAGIYWPIGNVNVLPWLVGDAVRLIFLMLGGGVLFLTCGCAILFGRRPRAGDALQFPKIDKGFWVAILLFWLAAEIAAAFAIHAISLNVQVTLSLFPWLSPFVLQAGYYAYQTLIWALIGLALPIAAFEKAAAPFKKARQRLSDVWLNVLLLSALAAAPVLGLRFMLWYTDHSMAFMLFDVVARMGIAFYAYATLLAWADIFLSLLLILVLSASTLLVYGRTAPETADLAKMFD